MLHLVFATGLYVNYQGVIVYRGSDIPQDKEWIFGELPNGVRYAVRKNGVPPVIPADTMIEADLIVLKIQKSLLVKK